jgi:hypothetical protein
MLSRRFAIAIAVLTGATLELGVALFTGRYEAWDSSVYWTVGLPIVLVASCAIGYFAGRRDWFWVALIIPSQVSTMLIRNGEVGGLWPLMIALSAVLGAPFLVAAFITSRLRPKRNES